VTRSLRAFVWLRWKLVLNGLRGGRRRDTWERISRVFALAVPAILVALSFGSVVVIAILGFVGGRVAVSDPEMGPIVIAAARAMLAALFVVLVVFAFTSPVQSAVTHYSRLLLLPISRRALHLSEVLAGLADPWVAFLIPGLALLAAGLASGGRLGAGLVAAVAGLLLLAVLATFGATAGMLVAWLLRSRRRGEVFTLVFVIVLSLVSFVPMILMEENERREREAVRDGTREERSLDAFDAALPIWTRALPSELYGRAVRGGLEGHRTNVTLAVAGLAVEVGLLFAASSSLHARLLGSAAVDRGRRRQTATTVSAIRLPGLSPATTAVAIAETRHVLRSVRGRLAVLLPGPMLGAMVFFVGRMGDTSGEFIARLAGQGYILFGIGLVFALHSLAAVTMNLFGSTRAGLTLEFLAPVSDAQLARGKLLGCGIVLALAAALCAVIALVVAPAGAPAAWLGVALGGVATYALVGPVAVWLSALFPSASDLSKTGSRGNPHALPAMLGFFVVLFAAGPPAAIIGVTVYQGWVVLTAPLMIAWLFLALAAGLPLVTLASRTVGLRRENLALVAQGR
jgi:hypothetical protein